MLKTLPKCSKFLDDARRRSKTLEDARTQQNDDRTQSNHQDNPHPFPATWFQKQATKYKTICLSAELFDSSLRETHGDGPSLGYRGDAFQQDELHEKGKSKQQTQIDLGEGLILDNFRYKLCMKRPILCCD